MYQYFASMYESLIKTIVSPYEGTPRRAPTIKQPDEKSRPQTGFTLIEVLIAMFILSLAVMADFGLLINADHAAGIGKSIACAGILAANEAERIKSSAALNDTLGDTTYTDSIAGMTFQIKRNVVRNDSTSIRGTGVQELEVSVIKIPGDKILTRYRVLQGREKS